MALERRHTINILTRKALPCTVLAILLCIFKVHCSLAEERISKERFLGDKETPWQITAEGSLSYSEEEGVYIAKGNVAFKKDGQSLYAQEATYNVKTGIAKASGDVRFESNGDILTADEGVFNLQDQTGQITNGRLFLKRNHYYISGDVMEKLSRDTYVIKNCHFTTCDGTTPAWSITGSELRVTIEGYGKVKNAAFRIRELPVFYVPYMIFPAKTERQTGLLPPRLGHSDRNGIDAEIPFFWAISDQTDATLYERYMSERGLMQGLEFRYLAENDSKGIFLFDILSDKIEKKDMNNPEDVELSPSPRTNKTRYWFRSRADQQLPMGFSARLDTDLVSDQDYLKEFGGGLYGFEARPDIAGESGRPVEEIHSPMRRSALRLSNDQKEYSIQALASYHQRPENPVNDDTPQPLTGFDFTALPRPLPDLPLFLSFDTDYDYIWRDFGERGHRLSLKPELSYPMWFGPYMEFEPSLSVTSDLQWFDDPQQNVEYQSRNAYQIKTRLSTLLERTFDFEWRRVKRLKHKVSPSFTYEYRDHRDEDEYRPWFEPIDVEGKVNRVTLSLDNFLDARNEDDNGVITYSQWGTFSLSQGYDIDEARRDEEPRREKESFEPMKGILTFTPFPDLDLDAEAHWNHYDNDISFADLSLDLAIERSGGKKDIFAIDYEYMKGESKTLNYLLNVNLLYQFSAGTSLKRDMNLGQNVARGYWLDYQSQCWAVRLIAEKQDDSTSFMVTFRILGLGDVLGR